MQPLDERALPLPHDDEDPPGVDRDLARAPGPGQTHRRLGVVPDHRGVQVAEPVDLGPTEERHVDQPRLQVEREQLEHARDRGGPARQRRIADRQREPLRTGPEHPGLVDELQVRRDGPLREVAHDVGETHAHEAVADPPELPCGRGDHQLGLAVPEIRRGAAHAYRP